MPLSNLDVAIVSIHSTEEMIDGSRKRVEFMKSVRHVRAILCLARFVRTLKMEGGSCFSELGWIRGV